MKIEWKKKKISLGNVEKELNSLWRSIFSSPGYYRVPHAFFVSLELSKQEGDFALLRQ
mgnify:CR=1 FL=1